MLNKQLLINYFHVIVAVNVEVQTPVTSTPAVDPARPLKPQDDADTDDFYTGTVII